MNVKRIIIGGLTGLALTAVVIVSMGIGTDWGAERPNMAAIAVFAAIMVVVVAAERVIRRVLANRARKHRTSSPRENPQTETRTTAKI